MAKTPLTQTTKKFDLKFFIVGDSGAGKTHFLSTYTKGPVHFYMFDRGGEKTIYKLLPNRPANVPITIDFFDSTTSFSSFWKTLAKDATDGFFDEMADKNGLVILPDSFTTANITAKKEIAKLNNIDLVQMAKANDQRKTMHQALWGQLLGWMQELLVVIQSLPCAVASTIHLFDKYDKEGSVIRRVPSVNGQLQQLIAIDFDEVYHLENRGSKYNIHFKEHNYFKAKSRVFNEKKATNITMDDIASSYLTGNPLTKEGGSKPTLAKRILPKPNAQ